MADLEQSARLFEASARLQRASAALGRLAESTEQGLDERSTAALRWAGEFLTQVDLDTPGGVADVSGALAVQATSARPTYYLSLAKLAPSMRQTGVQTREDMVQFLAALFELLRDGGRARPPHLEPTKVRLGARLLGELSNGLLSHNDPQEPSALW